MEERELSCTIGWNSKLLSPLWRTVFAVLSHFSRVWLCNAMDSSLPGSSVCGILQTRILEWVAISSSRGSSRPRDWTRVSCTSFFASGFFTAEPPGKLWRTVWRFLKKLKAELLYGPAIPLWGIDLEKFVAVLTILCIFVKTGLSEVTEVKTNARLCFCNISLFFKTIIFQIYFLIHSQFNISIFLCMCGMYFNLPSCFKEEAHGFL